jgi:hypothetical protein
VRGQVDRGIGMITVRVAVNVVVESALRVESWKRECIMAGDIGRTGKDGEKRSLYRDWTSPSEPTLSKARH